MKNVKNRKLETREKNADKQNKTKNLRKKRTRMRGKSGRTRGKNTWIVPKREEGKEGQTDGVVRGK